MDLLVVNMNSWIIRTVFGLPGCENPLWAQSKEDIIKATSQMDCLDIWNQDKWLLTSNL